MTALFQTLHYTNIAKQLIETTIENDRVIINYDPDVDGLVAGYLMEQYLRTAYHYIPKVSINANRAHGVLDMTYLANSHAPYDYGDVLTDYEPGSLILNVDSGISEQRLKELVKAGFDVVSLDHHELEYDLTNKTVADTPIKYANNGHYGLVINNQYTYEDPLYRFQSGSGVVLTFIQNIDPNYITNELIAFNALTLLSDSRDIDNDLAHRFLKVLYQTDKEESPKLYDLAKKVGFNSYTIGKDTLDRVYIDFTFSPYLNAAMRLNLGYESIRWINWHDIDLGDVKSAQKEVMNQLESRKHIQEYDHLLVIEIEAYNKDWFTASNFIGLFANRYLDTGRSVVIYSTFGGTLQRGSFRGLLANVDYRQAFEDMGFIALGHAGAFGLKNMMYTKQFWEMASKYIGTLEQNHTDTIHYTKMQRIEDASVLKQIATDNMYCSNHLRQYIKYTGFNYEITRSTPKVQLFLVEGLMVTSFDNNLEPIQDNVYLEPVLDKGNLKLYLKRIIS